MFKASEDVLQTPQEYFEHGCVAYPSPSAAPLIEFV